jgi:hypothetical protein
VDDGEVRGILVTMLTIPQWINSGDLTNGERVVSSDVALGM